MYQYGRKGRSRRGSSKTSAAPAIFESLEGRLFLSASPHLGESDAGQSRWILSLDQGSTFAAIADQVGLTSRLGANFDARVLKKLGRDGLFSIEAPAGMNQTALLKQLQKLPGFRFVEADHELSIDAVPNDSLYATYQYDLNNTGQTGGTADADIDAPEAWNYSTGSKNVVVAVIDTGTDFNHPDLAANIWTNAGEVAGDGIDNDNDGYVDDVHGYDFYNGDGSPMDDNGHGTHVAGTIGAIGNNGVGVSGVNWNVTLLPIKFLGASGSGSLTDAVSAINYAVMLKTQQGVNIEVINASWGAAGAEDQSLYDAINDARSAGILFVAAAGNAGADNDGTGFYPANFQLDNVISVAATDANDQLASFSNYGATSVHLAAPGVDIASTRPNNTYALMSGTSMAAPHVAGVAALALSYSPLSTYTQVRNAIFAGGDSVASLSGRTTTGRRLNALGTLTLLGAGNAPPTADIIDVSPDPRTTSVSQFTIVFSEPVAGFDLSDLRLTRDGGTNLLTASQTLASSDGGITWTLGNTSSLTSQPGTYSLLLTAATSGIVDSLNAGLVANAADAFVVQSTATIGSLSSSLALVNVGGAVTLTANNVTSSVGAPTKVEFYRDLNGNGLIDVGVDKLLGTDTSSSAGWKVTWTATTPGSPAGTSSVFMARATDSTGNWGAAATVNVVVNVLPTISSMAASAAVVNLGSPFSLTASGGADADGSVANVLFYRNTNGGSTFDAADALLGSGTLSGGVWTLANIPTAGMPRGATYFFAVPVDDRGQAGVAKSVKVTLDAAPQAGTMSVVEPVVTKGDNVTLLATGFTDSDSAITALEFWRDVNHNGVIDTSTDKLLGNGVNTAGVWKLVISTSAFVVGTTDYLARAKDTEGLYSPLAQASNRINNPPTMASLAASASVLSIGSPLTLTASTVADTDGTIQKVLFYRNTNGGTTWDAGDQLIGEGVLTSGKWVLSGIDTSGLPYGRMYYFARAQDNDGGFSVVKSAYLTLDAPPTGGTLSVAEPLVTKGGTVTLSATGFTDSDSAITAVEFWRDVNHNGVIDSSTDKLLGSGTNTAGVWKLVASTSAFTLGATDYLARAKDAEGLFSAPVHAANFINDPPILRTFSASPSSFTQGASVTLTASSITDSDGVITNVYFYRDTGSGAYDASDVLLGVGTLSAGKWVLTLTTGSFPVGSMRLFARALDDDGGYSAVVSATVTVSAPL